MAKKVAKKDPEEKARRKLAQAEMKLHVAQDRHVQARAKGKQEVEQARLRAAKWLAKTAEEVERRSEQVARAESRLLSIIDGAQQDIDAGDPAENGGVGRDNGLAPHQDWGLSGEPLAESLLEFDEMSRDASGTLREREVKALQVLQASFDTAGAAVGEWRAATNMPETTFARARRALVLGGFVAPDGTAGRNTHYTITDLGHDTLSQA
ncbi:MAG: hypothetical protein PVSMB7_06020 [Chloroflexota bacterium]